MKRLVLAGGGHNHIEVLHRFATERPPDVEIVLVSPSPKLIYTGMLPGVVAGLYRREECEIDLQRLAERAGVQWMASAVTGIDPVSKAIRLADDSRLEYDWLSINFGTTPPRKGGPGPSDRVVAIKPVDEFLGWWNALLEHGQAAFPARIGLVGAGAGGVELALAIERRLRAVAGSAAFGEVFLVTDQQHIMPGHIGLVRRWFVRILGERGIRIHVGAAVVAVEEGGIRSADGRVFPFDHLVWVSGAAPADWLKRTGLGVDEGGVAVNPHLQSVSHGNVFAAGDVASLTYAPRPKAGVFAIRQGPVLAENLRRAIAGQPLLDYRPQRHALALIGTGERYAVASRGALALRGGWVWRWKESIDRGFVARYRV